MPTPIEDVDWGSFGIVMGPRTALSDTRGTLGLEWEETQALYLVLTKRLKGPEMSLAEAYPHLEQLAELVKSWGEFLETKEKSNDTTSN